MKTIDPLLIVQTLIICCTIIIVASMWLTTPSEKVRCIQAMSINTGYMSSAIVNVCGTLEKKE